MKYAKDIALTAVAVLTGVTAVMGVHWEETAKSSFWWSFWPYATAASWLVWFVVWGISWKKDRSNAKDGR